ncbi:MAG TPA: MFS transporter [Pseudomonadales bacterium]
MQLTLPQVHQHIEQGAMRPYQWMVVALGVLINMLDGFDLLAAAQVAPILSREWNLEPEALGLLLSSSALGTAAGAFILSPVADLLGRRTAIIVNLALMCVGMLVSTQADSVTTLTAMRFLTGMGVGAMASAVGTLVFEYSSIKRRALALGFVTIGYNVGAVVSGFFAIWFLGRYSWSALFMLGGVLTLLLIPLVWFAMPESIDFMCRRPKVGTLPKLNRIFARLGLPAADTVPAPPAQVMQSSIFDLLRQPIAPRTLMMMVSYFLYMMSAYFFLNWNNQLTTEAGFSDTGGLSVAILTQLGGIAGGVLIGWLGSKLPFRPLATTILLVLGVGIAAFGAAASSYAFTVFTSILIGFSIFGAAVVLYTTGAGTFPARVRATGMGLSMTAGRLGSFFGPFVAGYLLGADMGRMMTCVILGIPVILSAVALLRVPLTPLKNEI